MVKTPPGKQPDEGLERFGSPEPKIKMIGEHGQEKNVEHVLDSEIRYKSQSIHGKWLTGSFS
jgi:hypothetical protein